MTFRRDGRSSRWDSHREKRRRHILDAAIAVVEGAPPGAELRLQDVAERAGLVRTVVQRHFGGRTPLLRAVQADVLEQAFGLIMGPIDLSLSLREITAHAIGETVAWVDSHPALHALVEREIGDGENSELSLAIDRYADWLTGYLDEALTLLGIDNPTRMREETRLLFAGVIGQVRAGVAHWTRQRPRVLSAEQVRDLLARTVLVQLTALIDAYRLDVPVDEPLLPVAGDVAAVRSSRYADERALPSWNSAREAATSLHTLTNGRREEEP